MEKTTLENPDFLTSLSKLSLVDVEQRLAAVNAERAALSLLRRSLAARERAKRRQQCGKGVRDVS